MTSVSHGKLPIVIVISGRGSNMRAIAEQATQGSLPVEVRAVISDKPEAPGLAIAAGMQIPTRALSPREFADRASYDQALAALVASFEPQLVVLAGFMRILSPGFIAAFADRILNIHPSLLPKYRGLHPQQQALDDGAAVSGATVHFVNKDLDAGPVVMQRAVPVLPGDTAEELAARILEVEHAVYPEAIAAVLERQP